MTHALANAATAVLSDLDRYIFSRMREGEPTRGASARLRALRECLESANDNRPDDPPTGGGAVVWPSVSYRGPFEGKGYQGMFAVFADGDFEAVRNGAGELAYFASPAEAVSAAGHVLVARLRSIASGNRPAIALPSPVVPVAPVAKAPRQPRQPRATKSDEGLARVVKRGAKGPRRVGAFVATWADGSETRVCGVVWSKEADMLPAAAQAADRLRRMREASRVIRDAKAAAVEALRAETYNLSTCPLRGMAVRGSLGIEQRSAAMQAWERVMPMAALTGLRNEETGEAYAVADPGFGTGDVVEADRLWASMVGLPHIRSSFEQAWAAGRWSRYPRKPEGEEADILHQLAICGDHRFESQATLDAEAHKIEALRRRLAAIHERELAGEAEPVELPLAA